MPNFQFSKICKNSKNGFRALIFGLQKITAQMHVCVIFEANPFNDVQNSDQKPQKMVKYAYFPTFENSPKNEK